MPRVRKPDTPDENTPMPGRTQGERQEQEQAMAAVPPEDPFDRVRQMAQGMQFDPVGLSAPPSPDEQQIDANRPDLPADIPALGPQEPQAPVDTEKILRVLPALEMAASQPGASAGIKQMVRAMRSALPPEATQRQLLNDSEERQGA